MPRENVWFDLLAGGALGIVCGIGFALLFIRGMGA